MPIAREPKLQSRQALGIDLDQESLSAQPLLRPSDRLGVAFLGVVLQIDGAPKRNSLALVVSTPPLVG
jgi:hypothetical protein